MPRTPILAATALLFAVPVALPASPEGTLPTDPRMVPMDRIRVPIIDSARIEGALNVKLVLDATDAGSAERVRARLPILRADAVAATIEFARLHASTMRAVDAACLAAALTDALRRDEHGIARILIVEVSARRA